MRGLIIATCQDKEKKNRCKFLSKRAFSFLYLYVVNPLASHVSCLPLIKVDTHFFTWIRISKGFQMLVIYYRSKHAFGNPETFVTGEL
jgi:hypothetical protein